MKQRILLWILWCPLLTCYDSFWYAVTFTKQRCRSIIAAFGWHNIVGINKPKVSLNESLVAFYWSAVVITNLRVVYQSAGDNYCSAISFTNPQCHLPICGCRLRICEKKSNRPKKGLMHNFVLPVYLGTMTQLLQKKSHFTISII